MPVKISACRCAGHYGTAMSTYHTHIGSSYQIYCMSCGVEAGSFDTEELAIKDWNRKMNKVKDISGQKFEFLTVLKDFRRESERTYWYCECQCGNKKWIRSESIRKVGHCGCLKKKIKPLAGRRFGRLLVQDRFKQEKKSCKTRTFWLCVCDCGEEKWIKRNALVSGNTTSCGCYSKEVRSRKMGAAAQRKLYGRYRKDADRRGHDFNISEDDFLRIASAPCAYCKRTEVSEYAPKRTNGSFKYTGVDRIDSSLGYSINNCQPCCVDCNRAKWQLSEDEFLGHIELIYIQRFIADELKRRCAFIGRWQPPHASHEALIRTKLDSGLPCLILVRDTPVNDKNPYTLQDTLKMLRDTFDGEDVVVLPISDIEGIYYGRGVGYNVEEIDMPESVKGLSATEIRQKIQDGDESWKDFVMSGARKLLEEKFNG